MKKGIVPEIAEKLHDLAGPLSKLSPKWGKKAEDVANALDKTSSHARVIADHGKSIWELLEPHVSMESRGINRKF